MSERCGTDNHRYFVADVAQVKDEGLVILIIICTACGDARAHEFPVTEKAKQKQKEK